MNALVIFGNKKFYTSIYSFFLVFLLSFCYNLNHTQAQANCTHTPETLNQDDDSCPGYPTTNIAKLDQGVPDGEETIVYVKVCGSPCCGDFLVNPKSGGECYLDLIINGPSGPNVSFMEIGTVPDLCDVSTLESCDSDGNVVTTLCKDSVSINNRVTFLGWTADDSDSNCSYWYYKVESKVAGCGMVPAVSHVTFGIIDTDPCPEIDLDLVKTVDDTTPNVGDRVTFTVRVENNGPADATGVEVKDYVPNGYTAIMDISSMGTLSGSEITWSNISIPNGGFIELTFTAEVVAPGPGIDYVNLAEVTDADQEDVDSTPGNGPDSDPGGGPHAQTHRRCVAWGPHPHERHQPSEHLHAVHCHPGKHG